MQENHLVKGGKQIKAPDKIYVASYNGEAFSHSWTMEPLGDTTVTEYIRKDTLLEWLQEIRAIPHKNAIARDLAFQEVVNKLNSI